MVYPLGLLVTSDRSHAPFAQACLAWSRTITVSMSLVSKNRVTIHHHTFCTNECVSVMPYPLSLRFFLRSNVLGHPLFNNGRYSFGIFSDASTELKKLLNSALFRHMAPWSRKNYQKHDPTNKHQAIQIVKVELSALLAFAGYQIISYTAAFSDIAFNKSSIN